VTADAEKRPGGHQSASLDHLADESKRQPRPPCRAAAFEKWAMKKRPTWLDELEAKTITLDELFELFELARSERQARLKR
jgi:hypothetical protein